ncbi:signal peptidase I [Caenispirillum salinarum]|uniref:signal peptidase I n=1 Tax=Caenispirillum salinarum TaxID=859058 RepID=UPI00384F7429
MFNDKKKSGGFGETVRTIIYAVLIAVVVRTVAFEPFNIPSGSMIPSLLIGDYLFVSKYSYGYSRHSFPFGLPPFEGRMLEDPPERGDVAVFKYPRDDRTDYIKRVIGLPGDTVQMKAGRLYLNGEEVPREQVEDYVFRDAHGNTHRFKQYIETLPGGTQHRIIEASETSMSDDTRLYTVPEGHYFMMGDNRDNSADSRADVGFVPLENFVGRAEFLFFSNDGTARLWEVWKWPSAIRWSRFFDSVD